ncbi:winged helix-turn-helix domain-containing protein [Pseudoalteromonas luteoviolacea]|uniref:winged helix-turn-helix domain-containing protein n=1 Tax=Pseudoalteromonas luteoviolacea TaxID=43657 RepID=UPI001B36828F|nr:winged helix-turn-helix domain-containing protein [Pseudoalteromonas luteoviolacea]MBQ4836229.1 winged helix-turn-helix domain-containing protein [Pseudoalteromonas luteoviolacea]
MRFKVDNKEVDLVRGVVVCTLDTQQKPIDIRAKTLQVLTLLVENSDRVVTKQELLEQIWRDLVVQDQVLVQSIKEIRDLLGANTIKTFPKKGYRWVADIELVQKAGQPKRYFEARFLALGFLAVTLLLGLSYIVFVKKNTAQLPTIAFLPVENHMPDKLHEWVPIKGMDQLTHALAKQTDLPVSNTDNVLLAIEHLQQRKIKERRSIAQFVFKLQQKLDAQLIVQTRLTGYPQDLQLHYTLHAQQGPEQGVILSQSVDDAFNQLISVLAQRFGQRERMSDQSYYSAFSNQAFAKGVNAYLQRNFDAAITLFRGALIEEPNMLAARRYLAGSLANTYQLEQAIALLQGSLALEDLSMGQKEHLRANLMIGYLLIHWPRGEDREQELDMAERYIANAKGLAQSSQDKLFIAYSYEELGKIKRLQGHYSEATRWLLAALEYHQSFHGQYGQTAALIELAKIAIAQQEISEAKHYFARAKQVADESNAHPNQIWVLLAQADMHRDLGDKTRASTLAQQALDIAHLADNPHLIARVQAWFAQVPIHTVN